MSLDVFLDSINRLRAEGTAAVAATNSLDEWTAARNQLVGRKSGRLAELMAVLPSLAVEERRAGGAALNAVKQELEALLETRQHELSAAERAGPAVDPTMPGRRRWPGSLHPTTIVIDEICEIFREIGFTVALGPEAESEWYNFRSLNFPADHPAMDLHDTLYLDGSALLRTHTSPVQVRTMQGYPPPHRILAPGRSYRRDFFDATHAPAFEQMEGLAIDEGISFADLKATLSYFARRFYGERTKTRFRPSYFPFTEPSAEMDVLVDLGDGRGERWIEILGSGLVHPAVLEATGIDSQRYSGWAFGMGPGRIALSRYGIPDIRLLYDSDMRFLEQFASC